MKVYKWPDGSWVEKEEYSKVEDAWRGDDFEELNLSDCPHSVSVDYFRNAETMAVCCTECFRLAAEVNLEWTRKNIVAPHGSHGIALWFKYMKGDL